MSRVGSGNFRNYSDQDRSLRDFATMTLKIDRLDSVEWSLVQEPTSISAKRSYEATLAPQMICNKASKADHV